MSVIPQTVQLIRDVQSGTVRPAQQVRVQKITMAGEKILPYSRRDYFKVWMTTGTGTIHYATRSIELTQPALIFSNPLVPYSFDGRQIDGAHICIFTEDYLRESNRSESLHDFSLFRVGSDPVFFLNEDQYREIATLFEKMLAELASDYVYRFELVRNYLNLIIHEGLKMEPVSRAFRSHKGPERIASLFLELLERQFPIDSPARALHLKKASDYAKQLSVHVNHLNHAVREVTGRPTSAHIAERVIIEAKALLRHTDLSVAEIAYCLGFDYPNYFNNFFKKNTGLTPMSLRK
jgi:AraC family transcriptional activator of pobA